MTSLIVTCLFILFCYFWLIFIVTRGLDWIESSFFKGYQLFELFVDWFIEFGKTKDDSTKKTQVEISSKDNYKLYTHEELEAHILCAFNKGVEESKVKFENGLKEQQNNNKGYRTSSFAACGKCSALCRTCWSLAEPESQDEVSSSPPEVQKPKKSKPKRKHSKGI